MEASEEQETLDPRLYMSENAPSSFVVPEDQLEQLRQGKSMLKIAVPGSIKTCKKRVESTSKRATKAARKTAALPQKNMKSLAKRLKEEGSGISSPSSGRRRLKTSTGSHIGTPESPEPQPRQEASPTSLAVPIKTHRTGSFDDLCQQEEQEMLTAGQALSPIQSHTYLLSNETKSQSADVAKSFEPLNHLEPPMAAARTSSVPLSSHRESGEEEVEDILFSEQQDGEAMAYVTEGGFEGEEGMMAYSEMDAGMLAEAEAAAMAAQHHGERKHFNRMIFSLPKEATKKSKKAGNYLWNMPKGVASSVATGIGTGMDRASGVASTVASAPGRTVSRIIHTKGGEEYEEAPGPFLPVTSDELQQFLQGGTEGGKFVKAVPVATSPSVARRKVASSRGSARKDRADLDKKQLRKEVASIKHTIDTFNATIITNLEVNRENTERLRDIASEVEGLCSSSAAARGSPAADRAAAIQMEDMNEKLEMLVAGMKQQQVHIAQVEARLLAVQRRQMTQVTIFDLVFLLVNYIVLGLTMAKNFVMRTPQAASTITDATQQLVEAEVTSAPRVVAAPSQQLDAAYDRRARAKTVRLAAPMTSSQLKQHASDVSDAPQQDEAAVVEKEETGRKEEKEEIEEEEEEEDGPKLPEVWGDDAPPPSVSSLAAARAAGILREQQKLSQRDVTRGGKPTTGKVLRPSFANSIN